MIYEIVVRYIYICTAVIHTIDSLSHALVHLRFYPLPKKAWNFVKRSEASHGVNLPNSSQKRKNLQLAYAVPLFFIRQFDRQHHDINSLKLRRQNPSNESSPCSSWSFGKNIPLSLLVLHRICFNRISMLTVPSPCHLQQCKEKTSNIYQETYLQCHDVRARVLSSGLWTP